jgi:hypothetical protein
MRKARACLVAAFSLVVSGSGASASAQARLTPPEQFFGHPLGADRKLARWDKLVEYYRQLDRESPKLEVLEMGSSTMGHPFLLLFISSPANLGRLEALRQINLKLSDPRGLADAEIDRLVRDGKVVMVQSMGLHATEVAASQMAPEFAYDLVSRTDEETQRILDNVVFLMVPCFNPDGQVMVADWYNKTVGGEYEGVNYPSLYHKYAGHDNNRDAFQTNLVESQYMAKLLFRDWIPQGYIDHHQMGSYGARLYVPPYAEPIRPFADPLVWRELSWYGGHIAYKEEESGKPGIVNAAIYSGWGHFGFHWITPFHNIAGMLTESASARLASPLFIHPDQLRGETRGLPAYEQQTTFPNPWPGGWWRMRDIVEQQKISGWAALDIAARNRETVLRNAYLKAKRQTARGAAGQPAAYAIPAQQHDSLTAAKLVSKLLVQGVEIRRASRDFVADGIAYGAGTYVVPMAQPKTGVIRWLLGRTLYPDNSYTRDRDGTPIRPYDMATDVMAEFMGVRVDPLSAPVKADLVKVASDVTLSGAATPSGKVTRGRSGVSLDARWNDSFRAVNLLLDKGVAVRRSERTLDASRAFDFVVADAPAGLLADVAKQTGVDFAPFDDDAKTSSELKRLRIGMYERYYGGNMDEGWTRLLLEQFGFPYTSVKDAEIKAGSLRAKYDVLILPNDSPGMITGERVESFGGQTPSYPPEYRSGIGKEGVEALKAFVQEGGTLLTFGAAGDLAIERFALPLRNVVAGKKPSEFWCPGSTLKVRFDNTHPLAYGMPKEGLATFLAGSQAYSIVPTAHNEHVETIATFAERDILQSGWLLGEETIAKKAAMVSVKQGRGRVVLIGFRPQHRVQTHGTFKLVFNALLGGSAPPGGAPAN